MPPANTANPEPGRRTRDARGRSVSTLDPLRLHVLGRGDVIDTEALERIAEEIEPGARSRRRLTRLGLFVFLPVIFLLTFGGIALDVYIEGRPAWDDLVSTVTNPAMIGPAVACLFSGVYLPLFASRQARSRRTIAAMLKHRVCPHCGYGLVGLPVDPADGATVCPECACAWRLDDGQAMGAATAPVPSRPVIWITLGLVGLAVLGVVFMLIFVMRAI
jgi:hypothetical protein